MRKTVSGLLCACILIIAVIASVNAQGGTISATLTDDTYYSMVGSGSNPNGFETTLNAGLFVLTFLKFNLSGIPEGATDINAVLELYTANNGVSSPHSVAVYKLENTAWNESDPPKGVYPWLTLPILASTNVDKSKQWFAWNVTNTFAGTSSSSSDFIAFVLTYPETSGSIRTPDITFTSKEGSETTAPKLTITWTILIPEFSGSMMVIMVGILALSVAGLKKSSRNRAYACGRVMKS